MRARFKGVIEAASSEVFYIGAALVGILQIIDGLVLYRAKGIPTKLVFLTSSLEFLWVFVCVVMLYKHPLEDFAFLISVAYVLYNVSGWLYAARIGLGPLNPIPNWYIIFGGVFGLFYFVGNGIMVIYAL